ncbi:cytochrome b560 subunit of succinate dehydrogenase [Ascodesmis nigricans]|uniref:Cytochrome b560 subunit of succinate dehydrogenase n=1 Tax=Ascodesmis nigricans TaxID=341454 RepID=A0A4S2MQQ2_9PEZI|nr:cytochrome b560 subunit of succinate dehydrogenase [Ascodesmis nigricans]
MLARTAALRLATSASARTTVPRAVFAATQTRSTATTTKTTDAEAYSILVAQRKQRPISPHLTIYQPQLTWYMSSLNRITGVALAASVYLYGIGYVIAPYAGLHLESASLAAGMAALPIAAKIAIKSAIASPFVYHAFNGVRHLTWDTARELSIKGVYRTGYAVIALTTVGAGYLIFGV